jgi:nucleoid-associated protein YgaU
LVGKNDTLSSISRKAYGTSARSNDILKANANVISSPNALKPGMTLVIPE